MKILQIGSENWAEGVDLADGVTWLHCPAADLARFIQELEAQELAKLLAKLEAAGEEVSELPDIYLSFSAVFLTDRVDEADLTPLFPHVEAHALFEDEGLANHSSQADGFFRRKMIRPLPKSGSRQEKIDYLTQTVFSGYYGTKLKTSELEVSPQFSGQVSYDGNAGIELRGAFGQDFQALLSYRYNLSSFPVNLELWPEYQKSDQVELAMEIIAYASGSLGQVVDSWWLTEADLETPYILYENPAIGYYTIAFWGRGEGWLKLANCHWRYSRDGSGTFLLGGQRHSDSNRLEVISYFNPGDMKPPLNVYFSGFRTAEGFEGFYMLKRMGAPFLLIGDPRLEGGSFYTGTDELEKSVEDAIQAALDYLGFDGSQLILSGLSMGTFGALYYASSFDPHAVVIGKPFTNLGDTVTRMSLHRPDEFETSSDMMRTITGNKTSSAPDQLNQKFWDKFNESTYPRTSFAIAFMAHDDYDLKATDRLLEALGQVGAHVYAKGYEGRHNDNSPAINRWFISQYHQFLRRDFGRKL